MQTKKRADYLLFKEAALLKASGEKDVKLKLISLKASMNQRLSKKLIEQYPLIIPAKRPEFKFDTPINPNWIAGFVSGDGSFIVNFHKYTSYKHNYRVRLRFNISQHIRDKELLSYIIQYFNCGINSISKKMINYDVQYFNDITNIIIPFFLKYQVKGVKWNNF